MVGGLGGLTIVLRDFFCSFPLCLEMDCFRIPFFYLRRDSVHSHDLFHKRGRDSHREISNEDVVICDCGKGNVVLKCRDIFSEGRVIGTVSFPCHPCSGEPGHGGACSILLFKWGFKDGDEVNEGSDWDGRFGDARGSKGSHPGYSWSFSHVGKSKGNLFLVNVVYCFIYDEVKLNSIHPCLGFVERAIKGLWGSKMKFSEFCGGHGRGKWLWRWYSWRGWQWRGEEWLSGMGRWRWRSRGAREGKSGWEVMWKF